MLYLCEAGQRLLVGRLELVPEELCARRREILVLKTCVRCGTQARLILLSKREFSLFTVQESLQSVSAADLGAVLRIEASGCIHEAVAELIKANISEQELWQALYSRSTCCQ